MRRNPLVSDVIAPFAPWIVGAVVLYLFKDEIMKSFEEKTKMPTIEETRTVTKALLTPVTTTREVFQYVTGTNIPSGPDTQIVQGKIVKLPYPNPQSQAEFRANVAAINAALGRVEVTK